MELRRPVLVTALDAGALLSVQTLLLDLPPTEELRVSSAVGDTSRNDLIEETPLAAIGGLPATLFKGVNAARGDYAAWIVVGNSNDPQVQAALRDVVVPAAASVFGNGQPLWLTLLLVDDSPTQDSAAKQFLSDLLGSLQTTGLVATSQVYLLRSHLSNGFDLPPSVLPEYASVTLRGLVFANAVDAPPELSASIHRATGGDLTSAGGDGPRLFGRAAALRVRSSISASADRCARTALAAFAERLLDRTNRLPVGWKSAEIRIDPPDVAANVKQQIGTATRHGPDVRIPRGARLLGNQDAERARLRQQVGAWSRAVDDWHRKVRVAFDALVREYRDVSADERDRARDAVRGHVTGLWASPTTMAPNLQIKETVRTQTLRWRQKVDTVDELGDTLRRASGADARQVVRGPLEVLLREIAVRPNINLMTIFGLLAIVIGLVVTQTIIGFIDPTKLDIPLIDPDAATKVLIWRVIAGAAVVLSVFAVVGVSLFRTRLRWDRAYGSLSSAAAGIVRQSATDISNEMELVSQHWFAKTLHACIRTLTTVGGRMTQLERGLRRIPSLAEETRPTQQAPFEKYIPDRKRDPAGDPAFQAELVERSLLPETNPIRRPPMAKAWLEGDPRHWPAHAREALAVHFRDELRNTLESEDPGIRESLQRITESWQLEASNYLARETMGGRPLPPRHRIVFAQDAMSTTAAELQGLGQPIMLAGRQEELLALQVQMGLDLATASR